MRRRFAAGGALLTLLAAAAVVVDGFLEAPARLGAALLLLVLAVVFGWSALVHRGAARVAASFVAALALLAVVVLLLGASLLRILIVVLLAAASVALTRIAFAHDYAPAYTGRVPVGPATHGVLIMNPWSGGGKVAKFDLEAKARAAGITPVLLQRGDDLRELAEQAIADGADVIGMAGGDGSQALVADVARRHGVAHVCVPAGTRNHFALDLGLDRADVSAALAAYGEAVEQRIDLALLGDRVFVNNASLGAYATVVQSAQYRDAKLATTAALMPDLVGPDAAGFDLHFTAPDGVDPADVDVLLVSNGRYRLDSLNGFGTRERLDGGVLGIVSVTVTRSTDLPALLSAEMSGRLRSFHGYREWSAEEFRVDSGRELVEVGVDGEALALPPPLVFRSLPGALRVRVPTTALTAPAAAAPARFATGVKGLFRVLAGRPVRSPDPAPAPAP